MEQLTPNRRVYTRAELYQIRDSSAKATALVTAATGAVTTTAHWYLPNDVLLRSNGIKLCSKKTRRGCRAGRKKRLGKEKTLRCVDTTIASNTPHLNITLLNAHSVRNDKTTMVTEHLDDCNTDIALLTETWLKDEDLITQNELTPPDFDLKTKNRKVKIGGGIALLHRSNLPSKTLSHDNDYSQFEFLQATCSKPPFTIALIYRPQLGVDGKLNSMSAFLDEFNNLMTRLAILPGNVIVAGDFNFHNHNTTAEQFGRGKQIILESGFQQIVDKPTHRQGRILDWVLTRPSDHLLVGDVKVTPNVISDHHIVQFKICGSQQRPTRQKISYRNYRQIDIDAFQTDLSDKYDDALKVAADGEDLLEKYYKCTTTVLDHHAPMIVRNTQAKISQPWFDEKIQDLRRKRRALERQWEKSGLEIHKQMYQDQTKIVSKAIKAAKSKYYTESLANADMKTTFKILNSLQHKGQKKLPKLDTDQAICDAFSTFFISKIDNIMIKIHDTVKSESTSSPSLPLPSCLPPHLQHFQPTDEAELSKIILTGPSKSCSLDALPTSLLKKTITAQLPILCDIINKSMTTGVFPASLKTADVTPLIKKTSLDQDVLKNYRPVCNLAYTGKLIEKVVLRRLNKHMSDHNLGEPFQSAYRPNHSTETALMRVQHDITKELDQDRGVALVLLDLSAAFDTINTRGVIDTLHQQIGVTGVPLTWFESYLSKRSQRIRIGGTTSRPATLSRGVPQGSVLGPVLFTSYTIPISSICKKHGVYYHIYADDTQLYVSFDPTTP